MPMCIDGLNGHMDGLKDVYVVEGGRRVRYKVSDPTELGTFKAASDLVSNEGKLGTYATAAAWG
jgi:hypothetical protein